MRLSDLFYYGIGFAYMVLAGEIFYASFKIDDYIYSKGISATVVIFPSYLIVIGLALIGAGIMLLSDPQEYNIAKLLGLTGLVSTIIGLGMALEYVARYHYLNEDSFLIYPIYLSRTLAKTTGLLMGSYVGAILIFLTILPAASFMLTEYEFAFNLTVILLNAGIPAMSLLAVILIIPENLAMTIMSAITLSIGILSLVLLDVYQTLRTIPAE